MFGSDYDDLRLLGGLVAQGPAVYPAGLALHLANGALFGALYANAAPALGGPPALRGPLAALAEHLATWPATLAGRRACGEAGGVWRPGRAFAQATWRHLLFGVVLGELERRLNAPGEPAGGRPARPSPPTGTARPSTWSRPPLAAV